MRFVGFLFAIPLLAQIQVPGLNPTQPKTSATTQTSTPTTTSTGGEIDVSGSAGWVDTGLDLRSGDAISISATGAVNSGLNKNISPGGASRGFRDVLRNYPSKDAGLGALIGRIGNAATAVPFLVGPNKRLDVPRAGRLFLSINKTGQDSVDGSFKVKVEFVSRGAESSALPADFPLANVTTEIVDRFPRRVVDKDGNEGDNTNYFIVGPEQKVMRALAAAGWVKVDKDAKATIISGVLATLGKQAYLTFPMSELMVFGRGQDYGFAHGEPLAVIATRHHFRLWKAPFQVDGQDAWVGAGTYETGFERDQRNNGITHKIDPDIDKEREYVAQSLQESGLVAKISYVMPSKPNKEAKTATGGGFHSDGRILVVHLIPDNAPSLAARPETAFSSLFCSVLEKRNPDGGTWDKCDSYLETGGGTRPDLPAISTNYRVLVVPGFFSQCASGVAPAFDEGVKALQQMGLTVETWVPPNASSEDNARNFAQYVRDHMGLLDQRKYIVIGYSKGAPDVQVALAKEAGMKDSVAAFVAVAGAIGGSAIADAIPAVANQYIERFKLGKCEGDVSAAFNSLKREVRRAFLAQYPNPLVPSYSIPALSNESSTSKGLLEAWKLMASFALRQDSQLAFDDAIIPGSKVLGGARADHLAVALPFDKATDATVRSFADKGRYPRAALLEAIVRFVSTDLDGK
jgi:hypothetical protein